MKLYEVTNGWLGESHVRLYAWAESEEQALEMAAEVLFDASEMPFATKPSDGGWERE